MTRLRTRTLALFLLLASSACSFHSSFQTGTHSGGSPEAREQTRRPRPRPRARDRDRDRETHYTAPAAHNHADHEVACTSGDEAAKARCEQTKRRAQEECDAIDREVREREAQAEAAARRQEEEAEAEAARQRRQAEEETAQKEREAEATAPAVRPVQPTNPPRTYQADGARSSVARAASSSDKSKDAVGVAAPRAGRVETETDTTSERDKGSVEGVAAPRAGRIEAAPPIERRDSDLREALQRRQKQIDEETAEKKQRIRQALGRTKADILVAAQRKRNEVHASLKEAASSP